MKYDGKINIAVGRSAESKLWKNKAFVLSEMCKILGEPVEWAKGLQTPAEGFTTPYYKKD